MRLLGCGGVIKQATLHLSTNGNITFIERPNASHPDLFETETRACKLDEVSAFYQE
jgi:hypothetical protein